MNVKDMVKEQTGDANFEFFYDRGVEKYKGSNTSKKIIINVSCIVGAIVAAILCMVLCRFNRVLGGFEACKISCMYKIGEADYYEERRLVREKLQS